MTQEFDWQKAIEAASKVEEFRRRALYVNIDQIKDLFDQEGEFGIFVMPIYERIYLGFVPRGDDCVRRLVGGPYQSEENARQELNFVNFVKEAKQKFQQENETSS